MSLSELGLPIVVGIDGSGPSELALDWAAAQAAGEGRRLVLLTAASWPESSAWLAGHTIDYNQVRAQVKERSRTVARRCAARVHESYPDLDIRHDLRFNDPRDALLDVEADLVVLGTRGLGSVRRLLLGSVADAVVKHATRPTVVIREQHGPASEHGVLVGVAGDDGDPAVIDFACRVAAARSLPVTAHHSVWAAVGPNESRDIAATEAGYDADRLPLARAVEYARRHHPDVELSQVLSRGFADLRLISASRLADLVVVGHRRKPFLNELVYGSAAPRVVEHAVCSVAVVPYQVQEEAEHRRSTTT